MNDNQTEKTHEERLAELAGEQKALSLREAALSELADQSTGRYADKLEAVKILQKADKKRFSSALSALMKKK